MKSLLFYQVQVIVASGILYGYYHLALRNKKFHRYNRFYLLAAFVISIIAPFLNIPVYFTNTDTDSSFILHTIASFSTSSAAEIHVPNSYSPIIKTTWFTWQNLSYLFYILIASIVMIRILFSLKKIRHIIRNNPDEKIENIHFVNTDEPGTPFSFFRWMFWNRSIELQSAKGEQIFRHELFHIQQRHSRDIIFMELMMVVFWINPFFHLIKKEVKAIHEFLADQFAVKKDQHWEYAELLLMQALGAKQHLVNPFFHNQIKRRIAMITSSSKSKHQYLRKLMMLPVAVLVIMLFAFAYRAKSETKHVQNFGKENLIINTLPHSVKQEEVQNKNHDLINNIHFISKSISFKDKEKKAIFNDRLPSKILGLKANNFRDTLLEGFLFFIDGKEQSDIKSFTDGVFKINPFHIDSVITLTGQSAINKYGKKGEKGVIEFITKEKNGKQIFNFNPIDTTKPGNSGNKIYDKVEIEPSFLKEVIIVGFENGKERYTKLPNETIPPSFVGTETEWIKHLERNINPMVPIDNGVPVGVYTTVTQFLVKADGSTSEFKSLTNHGYGMEEEALRVIQSVKQWEPAIVNGEKVNTYKKQAVTFVVQTSSTTKVEEKQRVLQVNDLSKYSPIKKNDLTSIPLFLLLKTEKDAEIISFTFTAGLENEGEIDECPNKGSNLNPGTINIIRKVQADDIIIFDKIIVRKNGEEQKYPSLLYRVI